MFILVIALMFVCLMMGIAIIVEQKRKHSKKDIGLRMAQMANEGSEAAVRAMIAEQNGSANTSIVVNQGLILSELLKLRLFETFKERLSILQSQCNIPEAGELAVCTTVYGIKGKMSTIILYTSPYEHDYIVDKRPQYRLTQNSPYDIDEFVQDNVIQICHNLKVGHVSEGYDEKDLEAVYALIEECKAESVRYEEKGNPYKINYFNLQKERNSFILKEQSRNIRGMSKNLLDFSYNDVKVNYENESHSFSMGKAMDLIVETIRNKENVSIFGAARSGKSYLADEISRRVGRSDIAIIFISPAMVERLQDVELLPDLMQQLEALKEYRNLTPLFVIDEAEHLLKKTEDGIHSITNSFMLSMMDGQQQKMLNCSFLLTFNCHKNQLNEKAFMTGRMGLEIELGEIPMDRAVKLVELLKEQNPTLIFEQKTWDVLSKKDTILLAEVYGCFVSPSKQRVIVSLIKGMAQGDEEETPTESIPTFSIPAAKKVQIQEAETYTGLAIPANPVPQKQQQHGNGKKKNKWKDRNRGSSMPSA